MKEKLMKVLLSIDEGGGPKAQAPACSQHAVENPLRVLYKVEIKQKQLTLFYVTLNELLSVTRCVNCEIRSSPPFDWIHNGTFFCGFVDHQPFRMRSYYEAARKMTTRVNKRDSNGDKAANTVCSLVDCGDLNIQQENAFGAKIMRKIRQSNRTRTIIKEEKNSYVNW
uniref:Uncharacterized protein n=1 Tax=Romanomermis culicivorax TaxID=13658 RepID=A0A915J2S6_ROMCU